jgi:hypothetical protein
MSSSDDQKPANVHPDTWKQHQEWMRVMESSRYHAPPMKKLMDDYFVPPDSGKNDGKE